MRPFPKGDGFGKFSDVEPIKAKYEGGTSQTVGAGGATVTSTGDTVTVPNSSGMPAVNMAALVGAAPVDTT